VSSVRPHYQAAGAGPALFPSERSGRVALTHLNRVFARYRREVGLDETLDLHSLRRSYVTHLIEDVTVAGAPAGDAGPGTPQHAGPGGALRHLRLHPGQPDRHRRRGQGRPQGQRPVRRGGRPCRDRPAPPSPGPAGPVSRQVPQRGPVTCSRCRQSGPRRGVSWPEGYVCRRCYQQATRRRGRCAGCGNEHLLPGLDAAGTPICTSCAGITQDLTCSRCGQQDEPHRRRRCARCCLREDLTVLLEDGTGQVRPELTGLLEAIVGQPRPRGALIWLRNPDVTRLLTGLARRQLELTHATFDADPGGRTAMHLRELLVRHGALPPVDRTIVLFQNWLATTLPSYSPATARLLGSFARWHHLRRMRELAEHGRLKPGTALTARQQITVAGQLLTHLETLGIAASQARQSDLDAWLADGASTRYTARTFIVWAVRARHLPALRFPHRSANGTPVLSQDERLALLRRFLTTDHEPVAYLLAAVLLLLYAQPTRLVRLRRDDLVGADGTATLRLGEEPVVLPAPVAALLRRHLDSRSNISTAANAGSPWLFPGYRAGQPLHQSYLMTQLREAGVPLLAARNSALRQLVPDMPPAVAAQALGYSPQIAEAHARQAGATWSPYAASCASKPARERQVHG